MRKGFKKYAIEFAVIFLSITFSFIVEEWRTNRQEKKVTKEFLQRLKREVSERTQQTQQYLDDSKIAVKRLEKIAANFKTKEISDDSLFQFQIESENGSPFNPELVTWESLKSSGILVNIKPEIIDSVTLILQHYKAISAVNKFLNELQITTWPMFVQDIPQNEVTDQWIMLFEKNGILLNGTQYQVGKRNDLSKLRSNSVAIDYYFTKVLIVNGIWKSFQFLPDKEKRLIEMIETEIAEL